LLTAVLGVDVGGTSIKGVLVGADCSVVTSVRTPTPRGASPGELVDAVIRVADALSARAGAAAVGLTRMGLASAGVVDEDEGVVRWASNLAWHDTPVAALVAKRTGLSVTLLNDARAAARAEGGRGAARGCPDFVLVTLGTGIGGAVVAGSVPVRGAHGLAGEIGHLAVATDGQLCGCGGHGCLETIASARAISTRYVQLSRSTAKVGAGTVVERALSGDAVAAAVWHDAVEALAIALAATVAVVDCELIVVGGGLAKAGTALVDPLRAALGRRLPLAPPRLALAELGDLAGALGAAAAASGSVVAAHCPPPA
jgi:glucokinase